MSKRVTVLMPVYNGADFLSETIDSVLAQTFRDFDFLIINDGSTDSTEVIIKSYQDSRIIYCENEANMGYIRTLNKGLNMIHTEYIARMDADDLWEPLKLEKQIRLLDSRPEVGICGTSIRKFGAINADFYFPEDNAGLRVGFLFYCKMSHPSIVFRNSFLKESGLIYREDYYPAEDYKMWVDSIDRTEIHNIPEILVHYRQHAAQVTKPSDPTQIKTINAIRSEMLEKVSSEFTNEEKEFHNNYFINGTILSLEDYRSLRNWILLVRKRNKESGEYLDDSLLEKEMNYHLLARMQEFIVCRYFSQSPRSGKLKFLFSGTWKYLNLRRSIKLLLR